MVTQTFLAHASNTNTLRASLVFFLVPRFKTGRWCWDGSCWKEGGVFWDFRKPKCHFQWWELLEHVLPPFFKHRLNTRWTAVAVITPYTNTLVTTAAAGVSCNVTQSNETRNTTSFPQVMFSDWCRYDACTRAQCSRKSVQSVAYLETSHQPLRYYYKSTIVETISFKAAWMCRSSPDLFSTFSTETKCCNVCSESITRPHHVLLNIFSMDNVHLQSHYWIHVVHPSGAKQGNIDLSVVEE